METVKLNIPGMKSQHCMMVVSGALKGMEGVQLKKVSPGVAEVELNGATQDAVVAVIEKAGYPVSK